MTQETYEKAQSLMQEIEQIKNRRERVADLMGLFDGTKARRMLKFEGFESKAVLVSAETANEILRYVYEQCADELVKVSKQLEDL